MPPLHRTDGAPVGAVLGVYNMINRLVMHRLVEANVNALLPPCIALVFDSGEPNFRHELYEADDAIATVTKWAMEKGLAVNLMSSDKDLLQLVRDGGGTTPNSTGGVSVHVVDPLTTEHKTEADVVP
jgi:DNA polymerase-1